MNPLILGGAALIALLFLGSSKKKASSSSPTKPAGPYVPPYTAPPSGAAPPSAKPLLATFSFRHPDGSREVWGSQMSKEAADKARSVLVTQADAAAKSRVLAGLGKNDGTYALEEVNATGDEGVQVAPHIDWSATYTYNGLVGKPAEAPTPSEQVTYTMSTPANGKIKILGPIPGKDATANEDQFAVGMAQSQAVTTTMAGKGKADGTYQLLKNLQVIWTHTYTYAALGGSSANA